MSETSPKILLTGATGFIGGTILDCLLKSSSLALRNVTITCLVRGADRASILTSAYGDRVHPTIYRDLEDIEKTTEIAAQHDIAIGTTLGFHLASSQALVRGLAQRKAATGKEVWMIHLSGTSNMSDRPISKIYVEQPPGREFDDVKDDIYGYEKMRESLGSYPQRATELAVVDAGLELGVRTLVMTPPLIYGVGTGLFNKISVQIPSYIRSALINGYSAVVGTGQGVMDHVHVEDLADLYKLALLNILEEGGKDLPVGKKGIMFAGNGRHTWMDIAQSVSNVLYEKGRISDTKVRNIGLSDASKVMVLQAGLEVDEVLAELALSSNAPTIASAAKELGWRPTKGLVAWMQNFQDDVNGVLESEKS